MRLLVGMDRRTGGRDALELARVLTGGEPSSALVVHVLYPGALPTEYALLPPDEAGEAEGLFEEARRVLPGCEVEGRAYGGGSAAAILTELAEGDGFDAIVVGSPHRGALGRVFAGSVATSLLNGAPSDVAIAPSGYEKARHETLRRIAVGYDGGLESKAALHRAESLARRSGAELDLVTVVAPAAVTPALTPGAYAPPYPPDPAGLLADGVDSVAPSLAAHARRLDGDPASELASYCGKEVDLLVVGSRGYGPFARVLLGSVSRRVVGLAPCPILVTTRR